MKTAAEKFLEKKYHAKVISADLKASKKFVIENMEEFAAIDKAEPIQDDDKFKKYSKSLSRDEIGDEIPIQGESAEEIPKECALCKYHPSNCPDKAIKEKMEELIEHIKTWRPNTLDWHDKKSQLESELQALKDKRNER
jgi:hypothetical protein